jgi:DNA-binding transcriptional LysR family regulator
VGEAYVAAARRILDEIGEAERAASGASAAPRGELILTAPLVFGRLHVLPVISEFLAQWADINVRLMLSDRNLNVIDDRLDMAVRIGALADSALSATRVGEVRPVVCGSPAFFGAHGVPKRPEDLSALAAVTFDPFSPADHWEFPDQKSKRAIRAPIRSRLSVNTAEAAIDAAAAGLGVTRVLSYQVAEGARQGKIQIVLAHHEPPPVPVNLIHAGRALTPLKVRMLLDFIAPRLRARLA